MWTSRLIRLTKGSIVCTLLLLALAVSPASADHDGGASSCFDSVAPLAHAASAMGSLDVSNVDVVASPANPPHTEPADAPVNAPVFVGITPAADGIMTINTVGSDFDTILDVYASGHNGISSLMPTFADLRLLAANDDRTVDDVASEATVEVFRGEHLFIRVDGFDGATGTAVVNWRIQVPDSIEQRNVLATAVTEGMIQGEIGLGIAGPQDWELAQAPVTSPNYYSLTPDQTGNLSLWLSVYGVWEPALVVGDFDENGDPVMIESVVGEGGQAVLGVNVVADEELWIMVAGTHGETGGFDLAWTFGRDPLGSNPIEADQLAALALDLESDLVGEISGTNLIQDADCGAVRLGGFSSPAVHRVVSPVDGWLIIDTFGSDFDTTLSVLKETEDGLFEVVAYNDDADFHSDPYAPGGFGDPYDDDYERYPYGGLESEVGLEVEAGEQLYVIVDGLTGQTGTYNLFWLFEEVDEEIEVENPVPAPPDDQVPAGEPVPTEDLATLG